MVRTVPPPHGTCLMLLFPTHYNSLILSSIYKNGYTIYRSPSRLPFTCLNTGVLTGLFHQLYDRLFTLYSVVLPWRWQCFKPVYDGAYKDELGITRSAF